MQGTDIYTDHLWEEINRNQDCTSHTHELEWHGVPLLTAYKCDERLIDL